VIRALLVDDEPLAIEALRGLLADDRDVEVVGACLNGREAVEAIRTLRPDLVLLDVQMPLFDGFEVIEELEPADIPVVVFITAYDQYSLRAFAVHAVDYLLKPVEPERFRDALRNVREILARRHERETNRRLLALLGDMESRRPTLDRFVIRDQDRVRFIKVQDVDAIEAAGVYAVLHRGHDVFILRDALSTLETRLGTERFLRVHRSWIVNVDRITEIRGAAGRPLEMLLTTGLTVPVSRRHRARVSARVRRVASLGAFPGSHPRT
jgi:two-component system, LytTR family, response regulator